MARALRIEFEGALYHILSRGNERRDIFLDDHDCRAFLDVLKKMSERFDVDIFAYVFMGNHYHLLLRTNQSNLSQSMQWAATTYTRRFNLKHSRIGHLFQGRFKSFLVQNEAYLTQLSCYIHRNPLRSGLVNRLVDYRWSSYRAYAYKANHDDWLKKDLILSRYGSQEAHKVYREKVQKYSEESANVFEDLRHGFLLGSKKFLAEIRKKYLVRDSDPELPQLNQITRDVDPVKSLERAAEAIKFDLDKLRQSKRVRREDIQNRDVLLYYLRETGLYTNKQIGDLLNLTYSAVSRRADIVETEMARQSEMSRKYKLIKSKVKV